MERRPHQTTARKIVSSSLLALTVVLTCAGVRCSAASSYYTARTTVSGLLTSPTNEGNSRDLMALQAFWSSIVSDPKGALSPWNGSTHFCKWQGVTCGRRHPERVVQLNLQSLDLSGPVHNIANLTFLRRLDLSNNSFYGSIPKELCHNLIHLRLLNLSLNQLEGEIPPNLGHCRHIQKISLKDNTLRGTIPLSVSNLTSLLVLDLTNNQLSGEIPPELGTIPTLEMLILQQNSLSGSIPPSLGNLTALATLSLNENLLSGAIPSSIGNLKSSLTEFIVQTNTLTGKVPNSIYNLSSIIILSLSNNSLSGRLPSDFASCFPDIEILDIFRNHFYGPIPFSIGNASSLKTIQMNYNAFSGAIPSSFGFLKKLRILQLSYNHLTVEHEADWTFLTSLTNCTNLERLILGANKLRGVIPLSISNLSERLQLFYLSDNYISGDIPKGIGDLIGLTRLGLSNNLFTSTIPTTIGSLQNLGSLEMADNQLYGEIPSSICNLTGLNLLDLPGNQLKGVIPPCMGDLKHLLALYLWDNNLSGIIPTNLTSILGLEQFLLAGNSLYGPLPEEVGQLKNLNWMDISDNNLQGVMPTTLGDCEILEFLNMSGNNFQGVIPSSFNKLGGMDTLDISRNNLSGSIPGFLQNFIHLTYLDLSSNNFEGDVPKGGIFQNASAYSILGNAKLCGGIPQLHLHTCSREEHSRKSKRHNIILVAILTSSSVTLCMVALVIFIFYNSKRKSHPSSSKSREIYPAITYYELYNATKGFSPHNLIGVGSFANVYQGKMESATLSGKLVAIKVIKLEQHATLKSFIRECEVLKHIRHRNLVRILTSCSSIDFAGNDFKALVFEFMQNGSLEQWLHPNDQNCEKCLSLMQRLNILIDVAMALSYLHCQNSKPIVHCDIKPSNILLDDEFIAHVSDFGIARILYKNNDDKGSQSTITIKGSIGYVAPEYGMGCNFSTEGDVYSYGILLLEIVTGRRPTDALFVNHLTLHKFVEMALPHRILDVIDQKLQRELNDEVTSIHYQGGASDLVEERIHVKDARLACLSSILQLGVKCSKDTPLERLQMDVVEKEIISIRESLLKVVENK